MAQVTELRGSAAHGTSVVRPSRTPGRNVHMRNIRWTIGRRIAAITAIGLASALLIAAVAWSSAGDVEYDAERAKTHNEARSLVQSLDTRSSELKVDAFKAVTLDDPTSAQADVADDTDQVAGFIAQMRKLDLDADDAKAIDAMEADFETYTSEIAAFIDAAVADQDGQRGDAEQIQASNEKMDDSLGHMIELLEKGSVEASQNTIDAASAMRTIVLIFSVIGLLVAAGLAFVITRSLVR